MAIKFYVIFVNDCTRYCWIFPLLLKLDVFQSFCKFQNYVLFLNKKLRFFGQAMVASLQTLRSKKYFPSLALFINFHPPRIGTKLFCRSHIVGRGLSLLVHSFLPTKYWFEAFNIDVYVVNRMPVCSSVSCCSRLCRPKSFWMCVLHMASALPTIKLEFKPIKCIFLGYNLDHKGNL